MDPVPHIVRPRQVSDFGSNLVIVDAGGGLVIKYAHMHASSARSDLVPARRVAHTNPPSAPKVAGPGRRTARRSSSLAYSTVAATG